MKETIFSFVRDYETVKIEQDVPNEFLLVLDNGNDDITANGTSSNVKSRGKGAYYKNIERKIILKKKRVNVSDVSVRYYAYLTIIFLSAMGEPVLC